MTATIVPINSEVTRQKALLDSFHSAANALNQDAIKTILNNDRFQQFGALQDLAQEISSQVECSFDLRPRFRVAAIDVLTTMMCNFGVVDLEDIKEVDETIEYAQYDLLAKYREIAIEQELLPKMFRRGSQHANHGMT